MRGSPINRLEPLWPRTNIGDAQARRTHNVERLGQVVGKDLEDLLADHPKLALAAAAVAGLLLGWMVKRK